MNKKQITALATCVATVAIAVAGATLAYFTDTDSATNTFTTAKDGIQIQLIEQQRNDDGSALETFKQNKKLYPIVGSAQGVKDKYGLTTAENYVDKIVTVKNLKEDAYVRVYIAIPAALVSDGSASNDILHWNWGNKFSPNGDYAQAGQADGQQNAPDYTANMGELVQLSGTTKINGIDYIVYYQTYKKKLTANEVTGSAFMVGLYLDKNVNRTEGTDGKGVWTRDGVTIDFDLDNGVDIPVHAVGVQAAGFSDADTAINAGFGENYNPWATAAE